MHKACRMPKLLWLISILSLPLCLSQASKLLFGDLITSWVLGTLSKPLLVQQKGHSHPHTIPEILRRPGDNIHPTVFTWKLNYFSLF